MTFGKAIRKEFPSFQAHAGLIYLDSAATTLKPISVIEAMQRSMGEKYATVHRGIYSLARESTANYELARERLAEWIGACSSQEIVFTKGTTDSINLVAHGLSSKIEEGDEILLSEIEHHSNLIPWQMLAVRCKARLIFAKADKLGFIDPEQLMDLITPKTRIVALAHMPNTTGRLQDFSQVFEKAHRYGAFCLLDGAQAIVSARVDVNKLGCDFYAFSSHKMYGPTGLGFLWAKPSALEAMEIRDGGGEMVDRVWLEGCTHAKGPLRFEAGTPAITEVLTMPSVIDFLERFDLQALHRHKLDLASDAIDVLESVPGAQVYAQKEISSLVLFSIEGVHPLDLASLMDCKQIALRTGHLCAQPALKRLGLESAMRLSFGLYNDLEDIERFSNALQQALKSLRP